MSKFYETCLQNYNQHDVGIKQTFFVLGGIVVLGHGIWYIKKIYYQKKKKYPKDVVILHQIPRAKYIPNISYHSLKIETFLRMASIPYQNELQFIRSPRGYIPWVEYNGNVIGDSQIAVEHLSKLFAVNLNPPQFSERDRSISTALRVLIENHLYWVICEYRWRFKLGSNPLTSLMDYPGQWCLYLLIKIYSDWFLRPRYLKQGVLQGIGKFNEAQVYQIGVTDIRALSNFIGGKSYVMGEQPSELDCCAFSMIAQILYSRDENPYVRLIEDEYPNLITYCDRMKKKYWDDWDRCCSSMELRH